MSSLTQVVGDSLVITRRNLIKVKRVPAPASRMTSRRA